MIYRCLCGLLVAGRRGGRANMPADGRLRTTPGAGGAVLAICGVLAAVVPKHLFRAFVFGGVGAFLVFCPLGAAAGGACSSKRPSAGGNIGGRRRAELAAQVFDYYGWRCDCCGPGTRWLSTTPEAVRPRCRDVWHVPLASGQCLPPRDSRSCSATTSRARANGARSRCTMCDAAARAMRRIAK
jgi:hypothetical protein